METTIQVLKPLKSTSKKVFLIGYICVFGGIFLGLATLSLITLLRGEYIISCSFLLAISLWGGYGILRPFISTLTFTYLFDYANRQVIFRDIFGEKKVSASTIHSWRVAYKYFVNGDTSSSLKATYFLYDLKDDHSNKKYKIFLPFDTNEKEIIPLLESTFGFSGHIYGAIPRFPPGWKRFLYEW